VTTDPADELEELEVFELFFETTTPTATPMAISPIIAMIDPMTWERVRRVNVVLESITTYNPLFFAIAT
jgi:hypothetical protein